jgi:nucleotide-binding universal stress UspA family protein
LQDQGVTALSGVEIGNDVVGNIMMVLSRERSDLIIISTHGVSGWRPFVFGSIAEKVIKLAECPLLLLRTPKASIKA